MRDDVSVSSKATKDEDETLSSVQLRKRNRPKQEPQEPPAPPTLPPVSYEKPPNPYETYLAIRRQVLPKLKAIFCPNFTIKGDVCKKC